jgi:hypothetical protein
LSPSCAGVTCSRTGSSGPPSCAGAPAPGRRAACSLPSPPASLLAPDASWMFLPSSSGSTRNRLSRANYTSLHGQPPPGVSDVTRDPCRASWNTRASRPMIDRPLRGNRKRNPRGRGRREPNSARTGGLPPSRVGQSESPPPPVANARRKCYRLSGCLCPRFGPAQTDTTSPASRPQGVDQKPRAGPPTYGQRDAAQQAPAANPSLDFEVPARVGDEPPLPVRQYA